MLPRVSLPPPDPIPLRAGPLTMIFEPEGGFLRYVRLGDREVLRGIYAAVRDHNWDTVPIHVSDLDLDEHPGGFRLTFTADVRDDTVDFVWHGLLTGEADGTVHFAFDGRARSAFRRNRIGFCILHPVRECAGRPCLVQTVDGADAERAFPDAVAPHQPFVDLKSIAHEIIPGLWADVSFEGDVFETEDQRNWTDASFKTYCTPLRLPFPVEVHRGDVVRQAVTLRLRGDRPAAPTAVHVLPDAISLTVDPQTLTPLPALGLGVASHGAPLTDRQRTRLATLRPAHLRIDVHLGAGHGRSALSRATAQARALGGALEVALFVTDRAKAELAVFLEDLDAVRPDVARWLVFHAHEKATPVRSIEAAREALSSYDFGIPLGAGTNAYFAELNRNRPPAELLDAVCYSINPQVHAFDDRSLVESLEAQGMTVQSARRFVPDTEVAVTPVTLKPRFNPNATGPEPDPPAGALPAQVDARQPTRFAAAWTLGSLKHLAESGADSVTYYETTGWRGVMERAHGAPLPEAFPSHPDTVFPLYHVLADVAPFVGGSVGRIISNRPLRADGLLLTRDDGRRRLLIANYTDTLQHVRVHLDRPFDDPHRRLLDASTEAEAVHAPEAFRASSRPFEAPEAEFTLDMPPHACACIDDGPPAFYEDTP